ncbi:MAG: tetratricopeptide repeat protein [Candidatus Omnitrophica bacterium]|nr:tetratricopeptide repeat protein [Candidatus Omnitrophota bacterium]
MKKSAVIVLVLWAVGMMFYPLPAFANTSLVAQYLVAEGVHYYRQGEYANAVHEFSKALLLDPNNEDAQRYLNELDINAGLLYGKKKTRSLRSGRLDRRPEWYEKRIAALEKKHKRRVNVTLSIKEEQEALQKKVDEKRKENASLRQEVKQIKKKYQSLSAKDRVLLESTAKMAQEKEEEATGLHAELGTAKDKLVRKLAMIAEKDKQIEAIERNLKQKISTVQEEVQESIKKKEVLLHEVKAANVRKDKQVTNLKKEIESLERAVIEKANKLKEKEEKVASLKKELKRLPAKHKAQLKEKDQRIKDLKEGNRQEIEKLEAEDRHKIKELETENQQKIEELKGESQQRITSLKKDMQEDVAKDKNMIKELRGQVSSKDKEMSRKRKAIDKLNQEIAGLKADVKNKTALIQEKDKKFKKLEASFAVVKKGWRETAQDFKSTIKNLEIEKNRVTWKMEKKEKQYTKQTDRLKEDLRQSIIEMGYLQNKILFTDFKMSGRSNQFEKRMQLMKRQDKLMVSLKEKLILARKEISALREKKGGAVGLKDVQEKIEAMQVKLARKEDDYKVVEKRLQDTEGQLNLVSKIVDSKDVQIKELEEQLTDLLSSLE